MKPRHHSKYTHRSNRSSRNRIRYAVVGLGHIAQNAILPAFAHADENSELAALVSHDPAKLRALSREYRVENCFTYDEFDLCVNSGLIDAVYVALPNSLHADYCIRAARAGIHVLCEKPLAVTEEECQEIIKSCAENSVKLMTAYRLHFEQGNLEAMEIVRSGEIGEPRIFNSVFTMQVSPGNIRTQEQYAGGTLYDIGIYCINAARYMFQDEPIEGYCYAAAGADSRFRKVEEMTAAIMRFPNERLAGFTASFGAEDTADFEVVGSKGKLRAIQAYAYSMPVILELTVGSRTRRKQFNLRDQFAPELIYFSNCILHDREPEPSGSEGLRDVSIIRSLYESVYTEQPVKFKTIKRRRYPDLRQEIHRPPARNRRMLRVKAPTV
ncbi:MAG TPA: Gfo/Idh/MocA family oxidoreductase [Candidatus Sulfotelmatobacter sp.]|nr:Gfo/Idh/MocA family oxidoreductase [Candidatus Sulfotelmatobacter sp.]